MNSVAIILMLSLITAAAAGEIKIEPSRSIQSAIEKAVQEVVRISKHTNLAQEIAITAVDVSTALNLVKLADMQKALANGMRHGHSQPLSKAAGDFDFF